MKKFIKGFLIFVVICGIIGYFIGYFLSSMPILTYASKAFLVTLSQKQYDQAYSLLSPSFQQRADLATFKATVESTGLDQYKDVVWIKNETYPQDNTGLVVGVVTTYQDKQFVVEFQYAVIGTTASDKRWLINNIRFPQEYNDKLTLPPQVRG